VDIREGENRRPEFLKIDAMGGVPVLELDDGRHLAETVAICRYFEAQRADPPLFGRGAEEQAFVEMWNRRMELEIFSPTAGSFRHTNAFFKGRITQIPEWGELSKKGALSRLEWLNGELAKRQFIAGDHYSIADITALV